jgi:glycosyltransferase involved in cell wall biosynthesis
MSQTYKDLELLVIDDGSTDATSQTVSKYKTDAGIVYMKQDHAGLSAARNAGIDASRGEYIAFLDADDILMKDKIEKEVSALGRSPSAGAAYTSFKYFYDGSNTEVLPSPHAKLSGDLFFFLKRSNFIHVSTAMIRRSSIGETRFDTSLKSHEDWDFFLKLAYKGVKFIYIDEELSSVRVRKTSMTASRPTMDSSRAVVGERARAMWKEMKSGMGFKSMEGMRRLLRYMKLRGRAAAVGFPDARRFNKPLPFWG